MSRLLDSTNSSVSFSYAFLILFTIFITILQSDGVALSLSYLSRHGGSTTLLVAPCVGHSFVANKSVALVLISQR